MTPVGLLTHKRRITLEAAQVSLWLVNEYPALLSPSRAQFSSLREQASGDMDQGV